jgi:hypothetical protein
VTVEIQLLTSGYAARCCVRQCQARPDHTRPLHRQSGQTAAATGTMRPVSDRTYMNKPAALCPTEQSNAGCRIRLAALSSARRALDRI